MSKKSLDLVDALSYVKVSSIPDILLWEEDRFVDFLESLLRRYVYWKQPWLVVPLSELGTWKDVTRACLLRARVILADYKA